MFANLPICNIDLDLSQGCRDPSLRSGFQNPWCSFVAFVVCLFQRRQFQAPPQVPSSITAIRVPAFGDLFHLLRRRHLAFSVGFLDRHAHPQIADGKHIGPPQ
jgi:hypothetical protein